MTEHPAETAAAKPAALPSTSKTSTSSCFNRSTTTRRQEVVSIPLAGKSNIADHMVIASGPVDPAGRVHGR